MINRHYLNRQIQRVKNCGSVIGMIKKIRYKSEQKRAAKQFGTVSFPSKEKRRLQSNAVFGNNVKFSILVPLYNTPEGYLKEMIKSVCNQTYGNWELCLADGSDNEHKYVGKICSELALKDDRILYKKLADNEGISGNTNKCFALATGDYIGLFDHDDILHPEALYEYARVINEKLADFLYCDEVTFTGGSIDNITHTHFKPDYAIDNLRANNYICHFTCFKRDLIQGEKLFRKEFDGSQDYDLILRLCEKAKNTVHVPRVLYYWRSYSESTASDVYKKEYAIEASKRAVAEHLKRCGYEDFQVESTKASPIIYGIDYVIDQSPMVSIIIRGNSSQNQRCIDSIKTNTSYDNYELHSISESKVVEVSGDYLLFVNNNCEILSNDWIQKLLMYAVRSDVGAVGAKIVTDKGIIYHAGKVLGMGHDGTAGNVFYGLPKDAVGYAGKLTFAQNVSAVSGECLMVSKSKYLEVGGFDYDLDNLCDVDLCLKLREKGYVNVFTPFAELMICGIKAKGKERNNHNESNEIFKKRWKDQLEKGDPYFNPNMSLSYPDYRLKT